MSEAYRPITTEARLSAPLNGTIYTTTRRVAAEYAIPVAGGSMAGMLGPGWEDSLIVSATVAPGEGQERVLTVLHARIPTESEQDANNWEYSTCSIGGQQFPSVQRTYVVPAGAVAAAVPAPGSAMPVVSGGLFAGEGYILVERQVSQTGSQLEPVFRVERRSYVKRSTTRQVSVDALNGLPLAAKTDLYHASEVIYTTPGPGPVDKTAAEVFDNPPGDFFGLQADGWQRSGTQLSCAWYSIQSEQVIAGVFSGGSVSVDPLGPYDTTLNYSWPPVLKEFELMDWLRRDGGTDIYPRVKFEPDGYDGPCRCQVSRVWSRSRHLGIGQIKVLKPTPVHYACPFYTLSIPACLHGEVKPRCDIGNQDSTYAQNFSSERTFPATTFNGAVQTTWPASLTVYDEQ